MDAPTPMLTTGQTHEKPRQLQLRSGRGCVRRLVPRLGAPVTGQVVATRVWVAFHIVLISGVNPAAQDGFGPELVETVDLWGDFLPPNAEELVPSRSGGVRTDQLKVGWTAAFAAILAGGFGFCGGDGLASLASEGGCGGANVGVGSHGRSECPELARVAVWVYPGDLGSATLPSVAVKNPLAAIVASDDQDAACAAGQHRRFHGGHDAVKPRAGQNVRVLELGSGPNVALGTVTPQGKAEHRCAWEWVIRFRGHAANLPSRLGFARKKCGGSKLSSRNSELNR